MTNFKNLTEKEESSFKARQYLKKYKTEKMSIEEVFESTLEGYEMFRENQGRSYCPFHDYTSPSKSFNFNIKTGLWLCRSCNQKGNIDQFIKKIKKDLKVVKEQKKAKSQEKLLI